MDGYQIFGVVMFFLATIVLIGIGWVIRLIVEGNRRCPECRSHIRRGVTRCPRCTAVIP